MNHKEPPESPTLRPNGSARDNQELPREHEANIFNAWRRHRAEEGKPATLALFRESYVGHYASIDGYTDHLIDEYELDAKLDAAIEPPFRVHVDIDVTALSRALRADGTLYVLPAKPVGVWVFRTDPQPQ